MNDGFSTSKKYSSPHPEFHKAKCYLLTDRTESREMLLHLKMYI